MTGVSTHSKISKDQIELSERKSIQSYSDHWCKKQVLSWLKVLEKGALTIHDNEGVYKFGDQDAEISAQVEVLDFTFYRDVVFNGLIGAGESYMKGHWFSNDPVSVIRVAAMNMMSVSHKMNSHWAWLSRIAATCLHRFSRFNSKKNSRLNIAAHYDLGNDFFELFLDKSMMYSSAIFTDEHASLEEAAEYKLQHICERLCLKESDHLLEIGTGWGGMAIYAAENYGCRVTTTTISKEQHKYAKAAVERAGLADKITVLLDDYRDLNQELEGSFDKLVSIEMIEAVGHQYYSQYFSSCSRLLKDDGLMLIQAITLPDQRYLLTKYQPDFIQHYIFPGGELPAIYVMADHIAKDTDMQIVGIEDITQDYARTLAEWRDRFLENLHIVKQQGFDDTFIRMWDFYLAYCEGGFRERVIGTSQLLMAKPRCYYQSSL